MQQVGAMFAAAGIVRAILSAIAWGLVLAALVMALGKRDHPPEA